MSNGTKNIGEPLSRVDGRLKVTGAAKYAAEYKIPNVAYGVLASGAIAKGRIKNIDTKAAEDAPGVIAVVTHLNAPKPPGFIEGAQTSDPRVEGQAFRVFHDDKIYYNGQPVALAIADTFERAWYASSLVKVEYEKEAHQTNMQANIANAITPKKAENSNYSRGDTDAALANAEYKVENEYRTQLQVHNPMEPHAAIAVWEGDDKI